MAWLSGWAKRREITVSNTNIDSDLTHFPLPLFINSSAGTGNTDITSIFTELGSNSLKIAVTKSDGTTQIYAEVEQWDGSSEAVVWVSKSDLTLSSTATTTLYLYYDSTQADNTTYVGAIGSTPGQSVWDSYYEAVWHLSEAAAPYKDSTGTNDSNTNGTDPAQVTGKVGKGQDFDKANSESIQLTTDSSLSFVGASGDDPFSIEAWLNMDDASSFRIYAYAGNDIAYYEYRLAFSSTDKVSLYCRDPSASGYIKSEDSTAYTADEESWVHIGATYDGTGSATGMSIFRNGVSRSTTDTDSAYTAMESVATVGAIGALPGATWSYADGKIDELRISRTERSAAWLKASYYAQDDNILSWGSEENEPSTSWTPKVIFIS